MFWKGIGLIGGGTLIIWAFLLFGSYRPLLFQPQSLQTREKSLILSFANDGKPFSFPFSLSQVIAEVSVFSTPQRPDRKRENPEMNVCLKSSGECRRIPLPCRLPLQFIDEEILGFAEEKTSFWLELTKEGKNVQAVIGIETLTETIEAGRFTIIPQIRAVSEEKRFSENTPFRFLADAKCLGHNLFLEKETGGQIFRILIEEGRILDLRKEDWLGFHQKGWNKEKLDANLPVIAHVESVEGGALLLEGWDGETYIRVSIPLIQTAPLKTKPEEIFKSIRARSERQISCMMEKQCLILRAGDWVLKTAGRWKVLRKLEEKEAYKTGKLEGELFIFERIVSRQEQKIVLGQIFNADKTQSFSVDLPAHHRINRKTHQKTKG